jgi:hypothetical protein
MELDAKTLEACGRARTRDDIIALVTAERERCAGIVQLAREGEIDGDFRSIIHRIKNP